MKTCVTRDTHNAGELSISTCVDLIVIGKLQATSTINVYHSSIIPVPRDGGDFCDSHANEMKESFSSTSTTVP